MAHSSSTEGLHLVGRASLYWSHLWNSHEAARQRVARAGYLPGRNHSSSESVKACRLGAAPEVQFVSR